MKSTILIILCGVMLGCSTNVKKHSNVTQPVNRNRIDESECYVCIKTSFAGGKSKAFEQQFKRGKPYRPLDIFILNDTNTTPIGFISEYKDRFVLPKGCREALEIEKVIQAGLPGITDSNASDFFADNLYLEVIHGTNRWITKTVFPDREYALFMKKIRKCVSRISVEEEQ